MEWRFCFKFKNWIRCVSISNKGEQTDFKCEITWNHWKSLEITWNHHWNHYRNHLKSLEITRNQWNHLKSLEIIEIIWNHLKSLKSLKSLEIIEITKSRNQFVPPWSLRKTKYISIDRLDIWVNCNFLVRLKF